MVVSSANSLLSNTIFYHVTQYGFTSPGNLLSFKMMRISKILTIILSGVVVWFAGKNLVIDNWNSPADDFSSIYVAARLLADGKAGSLYDHHPVLFELVPPGAFTDTARAIGFEGFLHPYVHIPLVAFLLRPLLSIPYDTAAVMVLLLNMLSLAVSLYLMIKLFCGEFRLNWFCLAAVVLVYYYPLRYGLWLGQTSPLVLLGIVALYCLAKAGHEKTAGLLLGGIISLKIVPLLLIVFFLIKKRWVLVISCAVTLLIAGLGSVALTGWESNKAFLENVLRLSGLSLASWNNLSLDGFLLRWVIDRSFVYNWQLLQLPPAMQVVKWCSWAGLLVLWLKLLRQPARLKEDDRDLLDFSLTLILMAVLPPISWSHYFIVLLFPYGVVAREVVSCKTMPYRGLIAAAVLLSYLCVSLPPTYLGITYPLDYFGFLSDFPLLVRLPFTLKSSLGFLGAAMLLLVVVVERVLMSRTRGQDRNSLEMTIE